MPEQTISDIFQIQQRFLRSTHLERDFKDPQALSGYVVTPQLQENFRRIADGLRPGSAQRAWRITGDYGTGKSSFALALSHLFSSQGVNLPPQLRRMLARDNSHSTQMRLLPVLVTGAREPLAPSLLRALYKAILGTCSRGRTPGVVETMRRVITEMGSTSGPVLVADALVIEAVVESAKYLRSAEKASGLLIILDELGKFLEYSALNPDEQDVYLLQRLAEAASRSSETPIFLIGLLHQGFNAYADQLSQSAQKEWEKVAGRFEEMIFEQPLDQTTLLVADALNLKLRKLPDEIITSARSDMRAAIELKWYGADSSEANLLKVAERLYPLHPTVIPALVRLFSRFGQNERSLFSFLLSSEPYGLQSFATRQVDSANFYRLHDLYDYTRAAFGHRLSVQTYRSHWNHIDSVISSFPLDRELELKLLKTIGILNLLDSNNMLATDPLVRLAVVGSKSRAGARRIDEALRELSKGIKVLYRRGDSGGYCLWSHTSVDLDKRYEEARRAVGTATRVSNLIGAHLETRPLVARRHYIQTGNLRHFNVHYLPVSQLPAAVNELAQGKSAPQAGSPAILAPPDADGHILIPLCETEEERQEALQFAQGQEARQHSSLLIAVTRPLSNLAGLVQESKRWEWIAANTPELNADRLAAEEVSRMVTASQLALQKRIQSFIGLQRYGGRTELQWFRLGVKASLHDSRDLMSLLSDVCDEVYPEAPHILNELVNRHHLSSAAAGARIRLVERILKHSAEPLLGMDPKKKPPEMSIYLSVLRNAGLHRQEGGEYMIVEPEHGQDVCHLLPALRRISELLQSTPDARVKVSTVFEELRKAPFGVRDGVSPILLAVFSSIHEQHVAFYDNGVFMRQMTGLDYLRLTKLPGNFEIQYCRFAGVRTTLYEKLLRILELRSETGGKADLLDVVRPLCVFAAQLPQYTHRTKNLTAQAQAVRTALMSAREPAPLLFRELPMACGFSPFGPGTPEYAGGEFDVQNFVEALKRALDELKAAYPDLQERIKLKVSQVFRLDVPIEEGRVLLSERAERILAHVSEKRLKAFCLRLLDSNLPLSEWVGSLGSLVCEMPPLKWTDADEERFGQEIEQLAARFRRVESLTFEAHGQAPGTSAVRIAVTNLNGAERDGVVFLNAGEQDKVKRLEGRISALLKSNDRVGLAALAGVFWNALAESD
ncbi:MAG: hypothetical protein ABW007_06290 [Chitinophagaceae bacterium]